MPSPKVSAIILAGGLGSRVGYRNKGLLPWHGRPMVDWVIAAIRDHVDEIIISANRDIEQYRARGYAVVCDEMEEHAGPLAGIASCFARTRGELILTAPCDMPQLPADLVPRLLQTLQQRPVDVALADDGSHTQYLVALYRKTSLETLPVALRDGVRAVRHYLATLDAATVDFSDEAAGFDNVNRLQ